MKHKAHFIIILCLMVLGLSSSGSSAATPLGSGFTYQGKLQDSSGLVNGRCDFKFSLWDNADSGNQVGEEQTLGGIVVVDGRFMVMLNGSSQFGPHPFNGKARWLQVKVRCPTGSGTYTKLQPRQQLSAAPYASYSQSAPWSGLTGVPAGFADGVDDTGGNKHNHLGQSWTGNDNPLRIGGSYGSDEAPLILSNFGISGNGLVVGSAGDDGVQVNSAKDDGVYVDSAGGDGVSIDSAGGDGVYVHTAGIPSSTDGSSEKNGFEVAGAQGNGFFVGRADQVGLRVKSTGYSGVRVISAGSYGVLVNSAGNDGVLVAAAGNPSSTDGSSEKNGFEVAGAEGNGLFVGRADKNGVLVNSAGDQGVYVDSAGLNGVYVDSAGVNGVYVRTAGEDGLRVDLVGDDGVQVGTTGDDGVYVYSAGDEGVQVSSAGDDGVYVEWAGGDGIEIWAAKDWAGWFGGVINVTGGCTGCVLAEFGINSGAAALEPGDIVTVQGTVANDFAGQPLLMQVRAVASGETAIGVVQGRAELQQVQQEPVEENGESGETTERLVPREGAAQPGEYVSIAIYGPVQVKAGQPGGQIAAGDRLVVDENGRARALQTTEVNGLQVAESAPTIGIALDQPAADGLVWVLINPQ